MSPHTIYPFDMILTHNMLKKLGYNLMGKTVSSFDRNMSFKLMEIAKKGGKIVKHMKFLKKMTRFWLELMSIKGVITCIIGHSADK